MANDFEVMIFNRIEKGSLVDRQSKRAKKQIFWELDIFQKKSIYFFSLSQRFNRLNGKQKSLTKVDL